MKTERDIYNFLNALLLMSKHIYLNGITTDENAENLYTIQQQINNNFGGDDERINRYMRSIMLDLSDMVLLIKGDEECGTK